MDDYVIFSIDNVQDIRALAKFTHYLDVLQAMGKLNGSVKVCTGSYKGQLETSFIMRSDDYMSHIHETDYIANQESVLSVTGCKRQYSTLHYQGCAKTEYIGCMKSVDKDTALAQDAWTYRPDLDVYWIAN